MRIFSMIENDMKFTIGDLKYCFKERKTDFTHLIKVYEIIRAEAEKSPIVIKNSGMIETGLNFSKLSEKSGFGQNLLAKRLKELRDLEVVYYYDIHRKGVQLRIYFNSNNENCQYLNKMLEKAKNENLL